MNGLMRWCVAFLIIIPVSCASFVEKQTLEKFDNTTDAFDRALKLGDYIASGQISGVNAAYLDNDRYKNIKIVNVKTTRVNLSSDKQDIAREVEVEYFLLDQNILRSRILQEKWHYNQENKRWSLDGGLPVIE